MSRDQSFAGMLCILHMERMSETFQPNFTVYACVCVCVCVCVPLLQGWEDAKQRGNAANYCWEYFLSSSTLRVGASNWIQQALCDKKKQKQNIHDLTDTHTHARATYGLFAFQMLRDMRNQFVRLLQEMGFVSSASPTARDVNRNSSESL